MMCISFKACINFCSVSLFRTQTSLLTQEQRHFNEMNNEQNLSAVITRLYM